MYLRSLIVSIAIAVSIVASATGGSARFYASVYSTNEWKEYPSYSEVGMYSFGLDAPDRRLEKADPDIDAGAGGVMTEDFYFCTKENNDLGFTEVTHFTFKPETWAYNSQLFGSLQGVATDLAYDHTTSKIYGCFSTDPDLGEKSDEYVFGTIDETNGERLAIKKIETPWIAIGCNRAGQLYAVAMDGTLLKVNKVNGDTEVLANLGFTANRRSTGAIDTATGLFYVVVTNEDSSTKEEYGYSVSTSKLYEVNVETKTATHLYDFADGEGIGGMYIPGPLSADDAPAAPTDFSVNFVDGSLSGTATFSVPDKTFGGGALEGSVKYLLRASGELFAQGTATPGEKVNVNGKVGDDGNYEFVLELSNAAGRSPKAKTSQWVGHDTPVNITSATLTYSEGNFTLSWQNPTETEHGGFIDESLITYNVTRLPDNFVVANGTNSTTITDPVAIPQTLTAYSYRIDMFYRGVSVASYTTAAYRLGTVGLPYVLDFDNEDSFDNLTIIDVNGDKAEWYREEYWYIEALDLECTAAMYPYSSTKKADDWLVLPALSFDAGVKYTVSFQVSTSSSSTPERLAVCYGKAPSADALVNTIMNEKEYLIFNPAEEVIDFTPAVSGQYYIGFHACSDADGAGLALRNIKVDSSDSSVTDVINDSESATIEWYNLQGVRITNPQPGQLVIKRQGATASKVVY